MSKVARNARNAFNIGEVWNPVWAMVTKLLSSYCGAQSVESHCKESNISDTNWQRYMFSGADLEVVRSNPLN